MTTIRIYHIHTLADGRDIEIVADYSARYEGPWMNNSVTLTDEPEFKYEGLALDPSVLPHSDREDLYHVVDNLMATEAFERAQAGYEDVMEQRAEQLDDTD